jgi:uncharacterized oxidoreductase
MAGANFIRSEIDELVAYMKETQAADPSLPVLVPGEPERIARAQRIAEGIEIDDTTWVEIGEAAKSVGASFEAA